MQREGACQIRRVIKEGRVSEDWVKGIEGWRFRGSGTAKLLAGRVMGLRACACAWGWQVGMCRIILGRGGDVA